MKPTNLTALSTQQQQTLAEIDAFDLDANDSGFSKRLSREQNWEQTFAAQAIAEYKRFVFLATVCDHVVAPSKIVDEVWHLHLIYTRSYWTDLCENILRRPFHHEPAKSNAEDQQKYRLLYRETLSSYPRVFGEAAPAEFWPHPRSNSPSPQATRWQQLSGPIGGAFATAFLLGTIGLPSDRQFNPFEMSGPDFLTFYMVLSGGGLIWCCIILLSLMINRTEESKRHQALLNRSAILIYGILILVGVVKFGIGLAREKPIQDLGFLIAMNLLCGFWFSTTRGPTSASSSNRNNSGCSGSSCGGGGGGGGCGGCGGD